MRKKNYSALTPNIDIAARFLSALANKSCLIILNSILNEKMSVAELVELTGLSSSNLSQHLIKLKAERLVSLRRSRHTNFYQVSSPSVAPMLKALNALYRPCFP